MLSWYISFLCVRVCVWKDKILNMTFSKTRVGSVNDFSHLSDYKQSLPTKGYDKSASSWSGLDADGFMCRTSFEHNIEYRNVIQPLPTKNYIPVWKSVAARKYGLWQTKVLNWLLPFIFFEHGKRRSMLLNVCMISFLCIFGWFWYKLGVNISCFGVCFEVFWVCWGVSMDPKWNIVRFDWLRAWCDCVTAFSLVNMIVSSNHKQW